MARVWFLVSENLTYPEGYVRVVRASMSGGGSLDDFPTQKKKHYQLIILPRDRPLLDVIQWASTLAQCELVGRCHFLENLVVRHVPTYTMSYDNIIGSFPFYTLFFWCDRVMTF